MVTHPSRDRSKSNNGGEYDYGERITLCSVTFQEWQDDLLLNVWQDLEMAELLGFGHTSRRVFFRLTEAWTSAEFPYCACCGTFTHTHDGLCEWCSGLE